MSCHPLNGGEAKQFTNQNPFDGSKVAWISSEVQHSIDRGITDARAA